MRLTQPSAYNETRVSWSETAAGNVLYLNNAHVVLSDAAAKEGVYFILRAS